MPYIKRIGLALLLVTVAFIPVLIVGGCCELVLESARKENLETYHEGLEAQKANVPIECNPYLGMLRYETWRRGWVRGSIDSQKKGASPCTIQPH